MRTVLQRLMDAVEPGTVETLTEAAAGPGVLGVRDVRARWIGHRLDAELAIEVGPALTLAESAPLVAGVQERMRAALPHLERALVRLEPAAPR
jgi:divalent metal cation (Fe/Co/Zn/Cd) transporter